MSSSLPPSFQPAKTNMTLPEFALQYESCTIPELKRFCRDRNLPTPKNSPSELHAWDAHVYALRVADTKATFRFLDLPPEIRNDIYDDLLQLRSKWPELSYLKVQYCYPQILATCKQIHDDASDIIYELNEPYLICFDFSSGLLYNLSTRISDLETSASPSLHIIDYWPKWFLKFRSLHIIISIGEYHGDPFTQLLCSLVSFLQTSSRLKTITLSEQRGLNSYCYVPLLRFIYPLVRLCARFEVRFEGFYDHGPSGRALENDIVRVAQESEELYKTNHLLRLHHLDTESSYCIANANLLQLNSDERKQVHILKNSAAMRARHIRTLGEEQKLADKVQKLATFLDTVFERTTRAQKYAVDLQGSSDGSVGMYQKAHSDRVAAFTTEPAMWPSQAMPKLDRKEFKRARDYWEWDARRERWHGLGLEDKFEEIEAGLRRRDEEDCRVYEEDCRLFEENCRSEVQ